MPKSKQLKLFDLLQSGQIGHASRLVYRIIRLLHHYLELLQQNKLDEATKVLDEVDTQIKKVKIDLIAAKQVSR